MAHYGFMIENEVFWRGIPNGWERPTMTLWMKLCMDARVIFDIGANHGIYSLVAKTINPDARIYGFEPIKEAFDKYQNNCLINDFDIQCEELAVSDQDGKAFIYGVKKGNELGASLNRSLHEEDKRVQISTVRLSTYIENCKVHSIDLMKIDVETFEAQVLKGLGSYLDQFKPIMILEILTNEVADRVDAILEGKNYSYYLINESSMLEPVDKLMAGHHLDTNYLICEKEVADKLLNNASSR